MWVKKQQLELDMEQWTGSDWERSMTRFILSPLYAEYIMQNARLEDSQARIKIVMRNINNVRHADDTTLMAESKEELESLDEGKRRE